MLINLLIFFITFNSYSKCTETIQGTPTRPNTFAQKNLSRDFKSEAGAVINVVQLGVRKKSDCSFPRWSVAISETADDTKIAPTQHI